MQSNLEIYSISWKRNFEDLPLFPSRKRNFLRVSHLSAGNCQTTCRKLKWCAVRAETSTTLRRSIVDNSGLKKIRFSRGLPCVWCSSGPEDADVMSDGSCQHLTAFKQAKGTEPFRIVHAHFVSCVSAESRKRKVWFSASAQTCEWKHSLCLF